MKKLFTWMGGLIEKHPVKVLLATIILFAILIVGVSNIRMATGNETLVQTDNEVYISNKAMETEFGGDSILVLFTDDTGDNLLSLENIHKMWNVEQKFKYEENIFSFMSPASIVHQMTEMQSEEIKDRVITLSDGLEEMSTKMIDIGNNLNSTEMMDPVAIENKINGLAQSTEAFHNLISGQNKLNQGAKELQTGLLTAADGLSQAAGQLKELSNLAGENQQLKMKLDMLSDNILMSSQAIETMGNKTSGIQEGTQNTSNALSNISNQLSNETASMTELFDGGIAPDELKEMATGFITMGKKLEDISGALEMFYNKSDMMVANIPGNQEELDNLLYEENKELRSMFSDVMLDNENALMVIKLQGNLKDEYKDQISEDIGKALEEEGFETISYTISGKPVLDSSLRTEMKTNMLMMVGMAVVIMLIVLLLVFKVRWRMLSLGIILISVIATLGFMGLLGVPITMVSMAVFPILIGLGIDYSIQFHNRYEEEKSVNKTLRNVGTAVAVAVLATVLGFVS
ncbi:MAG: MMPL family transporter, partial [Saprospiraceae bacterium]|nr:MMPL family transporter [Saprospiraceae bacterium]